MKPIRVLSVDFEKENRAFEPIKGDSINIHAMRVFSTPSGEKLLGYLRELTSGNLVNVNVHQTVANSARRDLVDLIGEMIEAGKQEMKDE